MKHLNSLGALALTLCLLASCSAHKKVPYIEEAELMPAELLAVPSQPATPIIQPGDLLNIYITSSNAASVALFNKGSYIDNEGKLTMKHTSQMNNMDASSASTDYYLVDRDGNISFPIVGTMHIAGCTKAEVEEMVLNAIYPKYLKEKPVVDVRFMNFRVTVLGAVKSPGIKVSQNERLNIFEALALAGDMDIRGDRENILLLRTKSDGSREIHKLNVHDRDMLLSPYYNLEPNDILIVNYNRSGAQGAWQMNQAFTATVSVIGGASALLALIISIINVSK